MSSDEERASYTPCVTQQSANSLKLKISFAGNRASNNATGSGELGPRESHDDSSTVVEVTSQNLFTVLSEIHNQLVRRDPRGIFANPVTDDIAAGYSQTISHPMDLGTILTRLRSRKFYASATDYLTDVTLMCDNAMVYNLPDTIYYQRARKLLIFCRKQLLAPSLRKLCIQFGIKSGLTEREMGKSSLSGDLPQHRGHRLSSVCCRRLNGQDSSARNAARFSHLASSPNKHWHLVASACHTTGTPKITMARTSTLTDRTDGAENRVDSETGLSSIHSSVTVSLARISIVPDAAYSVEDDVPTGSSAAESTPKFAATLQTDDRSGSTTGSQDTLVPVRRPRGRPRKHPKVEPPVSSCPESTTVPDSSAVLLIASSERTTKRASFMSGSSSCLDEDSYTNSVDEGVSENVNVKSSTSMTEDMGCGPVTTSRESEQSTTSSPTAPGPECAVLRSTSPSSLSISSNTLCTSPPEPKSVRPEASRTPTIRRKRKLPADVNHPSMLTIKRVRKCVAYEDYESNKRARLRRTKAEPTSVGTKASSPVLSVPQEPIPRTPPPVDCVELEDEVSVQAKHAAASAAGRLRSKYHYLCVNDEVCPTENSCIGPRIVYLNCDTPGKITATACPNAQSKLGVVTPTTSVTVTPPPTPVHVNYPPVFVHCLTGSRPGESNTVDTNDNRGKVPTKPLLDPITSEQQDILKQLEKLKYNSDDPISAAIHGPLSVFSTADMVRLSDVYGSDLSTVEYACSLLKFVEPIGRWARRWAAKRLDAATDGMHSQLANFSLATVPQPDLHDTTENCERPVEDPSRPPLRSWPNSIGLTVDSPTPPSSPDPVAFVNHPDEILGSSLLDSLLPLDDSCPNSTVPVILADACTPLNNSEFSWAHFLPSTHSAVYGGSSLLSHIAVDATRSTVVSDPLITCSYAPTYATVIQSDPIPSADNVDVKVSSSSLHQAVCSNDDASVQSDTNAVVTNRINAPLHPILDVSVAPCSDTSASNFLLKSALTSVAPSSVKKDAVTLSMESQCTSVVETECTQQDTTGHPLVLQKQSDSRQELALSSSDNCHQVSVTQDNDVLNSKTDAAPHLHEFSVCTATAADCQKDENIVTHETPQPTGQDDVRVSSSTPTEYELCHTNTSHGETSPPSCSGDLVTCQDTTAKDDGSVSIKSEASISVITDVSANTVSIPRQNPALGQSDGPIWHSDLISENSTSCSSQPDSLTGHKSPTAKDDGVDEMKSSSFDSQLLPYPNPGDHVDLPPTTAIDESNVWTISSACASNQKSSEQNEYDNVDSVSCKQESSESPHAPTVCLTSVSDDLTAHECGTPKHETAYPDHKPDPPDDAVCAIPIGSFVSPGDCRPDVPIQTSNDVNANIDPSQNETTSIQELGNVVVALAVEHNTLASFTHVNENTQ